MTMMVTINIFNHHHGDDIIASIIRSMSSIFNHLLACLCCADLLFLISNLLINPIHFGFENSVTRFWIFTASKDLVLREVEMIFSSSHFHFYYQCVVSSS